VRSLIDVLFDAARMMVDPDGYRLALMSGAWRQAVGETIDARTRLAGISGRTLRVVCSDRNWKRQLDALRPDILGKLEFLGRHRPLELQFTFEGDALPPRRKRGGRPKKARTPAKGPAARSGKPAAKRHAAPRRMRRP